MLIGGELSLVHVEDDDAAGKSTRLRIIVGVGAVALLSSLAIGVIGYPARR